MRSRAHPPAVSVNRHTVIEPLSRRSLLQIGAATTGTALVGAAAVSAAGPAGAAPTVFAHGVASGDPLPDAVVLWTRVTPTPRRRRAPGAGRRVPVTWEVATDPAFRRDRPHAARCAPGPPRDHTVKVDAARAAPRRRRTGTGSAARGQTSPVGRTRTAPGGGRRRRPAAHGRRLLREPAGRLVHRLPPPGRARPTSTSSSTSATTSTSTRPAEYQARDVVVRPHDPPREMVGLADYRRRHAQYKTDPDLQALHAAAPWVVTWDDHESANDSWSGGAENHTPGAEGRGARGARPRQQAYAEWMPVRYEAGRAPLPAAAASAAWPPVDAGPAQLPRRAGRARRSIRRVNDPARTIAGPRAAAVPARRARRRCRCSGSWSATR